MSRVGEMIDRSWLTNNGPFVQELEKRIAEYVGVRNCVATCNATVALEISIRALGMTGEVIIPSFTFIATAHALQWQQITPVFADIREKDYCLDPTSIERMITPRTTGIIGVHLWGQACDVKALVDIAKRRKLRLMFDAAHAFGCTYQNRMIGSNGDCEVFSFHATKFFNTLEGGAVVTNDDSLAEKIRLMRNFGFAGVDQVIYLGTNGKMNELSAAMGLTNLESIGAILRANRENWEAYQYGLRGIAGIRLLPLGEQEKCNYQYVVVDVDSSVTNVTRDELVASLWLENIIARKYFWPGCHLMEPYQTLYPNAGLLLPITERLAKRVLLLPTGTAVSPDTVAMICDVIRTIVSHGEQIRAKLI